MELSPKGAIPMKPDAIPKRDRLTDGQVDQVRELVREMLAAERDIQRIEREAEHEAERDKREAEYKQLTAEISEVVGEAVGKLLDAQYERIKSELEASLRARVVETEALKQTLGEIRSLVVSENDKLVDVPTARRVN
jgi:vacuolar-type H+-ATPase subunit E/Vma4